jgi:hypothetical protein
VLAPALLFMTSILPANAQDRSGALQPDADVLLTNIKALRTETSEMRAMLEDLKAEMIRARAEAAELKRELAVTREELATAVSQKKENDSQTLEKLEEDHQLLSAKVDDQYQTKVESASKYRVRFSGAILMNLLSTRGAVDNLDFPSFVLADSPGYSRGSFAGSVRQSLLGFELFGPEIGGKRVEGDVQFDFAGGFPNTPNGLTFPLPRLRTAMIRLSSPSTTIAAGQDAPFFSPLSPTSVASMAVPAFSYSGNLWAWIPQVRIEQRLNLKGDSHVVLQGGILDPLSGEPPLSQYFRTPQAGEASRQPAYASRIAWSRHASGHDLAVGTGGYYSRQSWGFNRSVDAWAGTMDWTIPVTSPLEFSGEFYYGQAIGGIGGGLGRSVLFSGPISDTASQVKPLTARGGWTQLKFHQTEKLEWNGAFGQDSVPAHTLRLFPIAQQIYADPSITRNRSSLLNFVYRPRSDVLLSLEYRRIRTFRIYGDPEHASQVSLSMGVLF